MIKQAILFVVSTGTLIYFIAPVDDEKAAEPIAEETSKTKSAVKSSASDQWSYDDDEGTEEFVFGEPLEYSDDADTPAGNSGEIAGTAGPTIDEPTKRIARTNYISPAVYSKAPKPGGPGSKENPIDMTPPGGRKLPQPKP
ncbi:hypothetical protein [Sphingorhabdus sp. EL138]|jgi:hypothetical protein|uniref:hypothetical protein n=1 Tax=Sphingorhabdus sp. EL138 TaxID=2073156 RepID=UPI000D69B45A|nr:hypothetical protein [Sphingorhabdus sp. EL138]